MKSPKKKPTILYRFVIAASKVLFRFFYRHRVYGLEHIPVSAAIIASNHASFLDPPALAISVPGEIFFLARKSLFIKKKWFGRLIFALNARPISGEASNVHILNEIKELLKNGGKVILFPEGTRTKDGEIGRIKGGVSMLMAHSHCSTIPVFIYGTGTIWNRAQKWPKLWGHTACVFGSPLVWDKYALLEKKEGQRQFAEDLRKAILGLKAWHEKGAKGFPP